MITRGELRMEPPAGILSAARAWLAKVRPALERDFIAAYLTGSVLTQGFDPQKSRINILVLSRSLSGDVLDAIAKALPPPPRSGPRFDPLFMTHRNMEMSLDSFPIEWLEIQERHLLLEGDDVVATAQVPQTYLRLQCEHELRGKFIQLRQAYLHFHGQAPELERTLAGAASGFAALFRTLLRLRGEPVPATAAQVVERVSDVFELDAHGLLAAHLTRYGGRKHTAEEVASHYRKFLTELDRLSIAIDQLRVP